MTVASHVVENNVAACKCIVRMDARIIVSSGLQHADENSGLLGLQFLRRGAEIGLSCRLDAKGIGTEIHSVSILGEDFLLAEIPL